MHGTRVSEGKAGCKAEPLRRFVDGEDVLGIPALAVNDESKLPLPLLLFLPSPLWGR
jgi:hypothetical protein